LPFESLLIVTYQQSGLSSIIIIVYFYNYHHRQKPSASLSELLISIYTNQLAESLPRNSYAKRGICRHRVSICLSVCV